MFKHNKYYILYLKITQSASNRSFFKGSEKHHIIPRCIGGTNHVDNLVYLTFREHFICHKLLLKCLEDKTKAKRMFSAMCMVRSKKLSRIKTSKRYEYYRLLGIKALTGTHHTETTRNKIRTSLKGKKHTEERKRKIGRTLSIINARAGNPNAKKWKVVNTSTGEYFYCTGNLLEECRSRGISGYLLMEKLRKNKPPSTNGKTANWKLELLP